MKNLFTSFILLTFTTYSFISRGQCPSNKAQLEIAVSYGLVTGSQVSDQISNNEHSDGKTTTYNSGNTFLTVRYFLFNRLALGFSGGITNEKGQYTDRTNPALISSTYKTSFTTVAMELYYVYQFRKHLEVYTLAGFGPSFTTTETTSNVSPTSGAITTAKEDKIKAQYTSLGIHYGGRLGGFVEIGIGYKGLINGGISYKFGSSCWWKQ